MAKGRTPHTALAFDWGLTHIGVATGRILPSSATALTHLPARDGVPDWHLIKNLLAEWQPDIVVVGLPTNLDGREGELAPRARRFGRRLAGRFGCTVEFQDERLSTREAYSRTEPGTNPEVLHAIAAQVILEDWQASRAQVAANGSLLN